MRSIGGILVVVASAPLAAAFACGGQPPMAAKATATPPSVASAHAPASASAMPSASALPASISSASAATASQAPSLEWLSLLAPQPVTTKVGDFVWAAVPTDKGVRFGVYRVLATEGDAASLQDMLRVRWDKVPGAVVQPVAWNAMATLKKDDVVTYADWRGYVGIAVVVSPFPKLRVTFRDGSAVVREESANIAQRLVEDVAPLAWVTYPRPSDATVLDRGIVFATAGDKVLVREDAGVVVVVARSLARVIAVPRRALKQGDSVLAWTDTQGYRAGVVGKELLARLSYAVDVAGDIRSYFFSDLALAPTP